jgi:hypothetical protein
MRTNPDHDPIVSLDLGDLVRDGTVDVDEPSSRHEKAGHPQYGKPAAKKAEPEKAASAAKSAEKK